MASVIILDGVRKQREEEKNPHMHGPAHCMQCEHKWEGVAPVGIVKLQCPNCFTTKGLFTHHVDVNEAHWECNCGNKFFMIGESGAVYCPNCGKVQEGIYD